MRTFRLLATVILLWFAGMLALASRAGMAEAIVLAAVVSVAAYLLFRKDGIVTAIGALANRRSRRPR